MLAATRAAGYERATVVFQPHRVTRTLALVDQFATAFEGARHVIVTDLYLAGEANPDARHRGDRGRRVDSRRTPRWTRSTAAISPSWRSCSSISSPTVTSFLFLGAGDVGSVIATLPGGLT